MTLYLKNVLKNLFTLSKASYKLNITLLDRTFFWTIRLWSYKTLYYDAYLFQASCKINFDSQTRLLLMKLPPNKLNDPVNKLNEKRPEPKQQCGISEFSNNK